MSIAPQGDRQLTIRTLTAADLPEFSEVLAAAFLSEHNDDLLGWEETIFEPERCHGVFDGSLMVGTGEILSRRMTLPGTGPTPVGAITSISVAPGHRRRGVLSMIMRAQLEMLRESGEPIAVLWASEGAIYGRFGYGLATEQARLALPKGAAFRGDIEVDPERVRELPRQQALPLIRAIYDKVALQRTGYLDRSERNWAFLLYDKEFLRREMTSLRFAVHPEGYAVYRAKLSWDNRGPDSPMTVYEVMAANPRAYAAIVRYLLDMDLVGEVTLRQVPVDEPVVQLLADPRAALRTVLDGVWVRVIDVERALRARRYAAPLDVVLEIDDRLCPDNAGRWRLVVGPDGSAEVTRAEAPVDLALNVDALGAAYLGGTRLSTLAAVGRVREHSPGAVARASLSFLHEPAPRCFEHF